MFENKLKLSIVIPVYNIEKYISKCIDSLLNQDVDKSSYEIICVNDGSSDNSLSVLREYERKYSNLKVIDKENGGVSSAKNIGIDTANGEYCFVDGDDIFMPNSFGKLYGNFGDDMVEFAFTKVEENFEEINPSYNIENYLIENAADLCWNRLYRLSIIKDNGIRFDLNMKYAEDTFFVMAYRSYSKTVKHIDECLYLYRQREESTLHTKGKKRYIIQSNSLKVLCSRGTKELLPRVKKGSKEYSFIKRCITEDKIAILYLSPLTGEKRKDVVKFFKENKLYPINSNKEQVKGVVKIKYKIKCTLMGLLRFRIVYFFYFWLAKFLTRKLSKFN